MSIVYNPFESGTGESETVIQNEFQACVIYASSGNAQEIPVSTETIIEFDSIDIDTAAFADLANNRIVIPNLANIYFFVGCQIKLDSSSEYHNLKLSHFNSDGQIIDVYELSSGADSVLVSAINAEVLVTCSSGNYFNLTYYHEEASPINTIPHSREVLLYLYTAG